MTLGELIKQYRTEHDMSLREFSRISNLSNGYISMLENNQHPKTKKPIVPSLEKMKFIASAMGITLDKLLEAIDENQPISIGKDSTVSVDPIELTVDERKLVYIYRKLNTNGKQKLSERADELIGLGYLQKGDNGSRMA